MHATREVSPIEPTILSPRSLPLADIAAKYCRDGLVVSAADPADYAEVDTLARGASPAEIFRPLTAPLLSWFIDANPAGPGFLVVARPAAGGPILGHFLFYATTLLHGEAGGARAVPSYLYVHLYVSPACRRRGMFAAMFAFGLDVLGAMRVPFAYTVPNQRSAPGFVKFGVPLLGVLPVRMAPAWATWNALARATAGGGRSGDIIVERLARFDDEMLGAARLRGAVCGLRNAEFLEWRFRRRPDAEYGIWGVRTPGGAAGYLVTRVLDIQKYRVLAICDLALEPFDGCTLAAALRHVVRALAAERADLVMLQGGPPDPPSRRALLGAGLLPVPNRVLPQPVAVFGGAPGERGSTAGLPLLDRWCLTPGDWDVF